MALLRAFRKQLKEKACPACGMLIPFGRFRSHVNGCIVDSDDEECTVVERITLEDKRRLVLERIVNLDETPLSLQKIDGDSLKSTETDSDIAEKEQISTGKTQDSGVNFAGLSDNPKKRSRKYNICDRNFKKKRKEANYDKGNGTRSEGEVDVGECAAIGRVNSGESYSRSSESVTAASTSSAVEAPTCFKATTSNTISLDYVVKENGNQRKRRSNDVPELCLEEVDTCIQNYLRDCSCELAAYKSPAKAAQGQGIFEKEADPYYLVFFLKILKRVFYSETMRYPSSFWGDELRFVYKFISLTEPAKQLFVRIFLRKRRWLLAEKLKYPDIASDLIPLFKELESAGLVDSDEPHLSDLNEAINLLHASSLKVIGRQFKVDVNVGRKEMCKMLLKAATHKNVLGFSISSQMLKKVKLELGQCFRLKEAASEFFNAVFTLYSPCDMSSSHYLDQPGINLCSQLLFCMLQRETGKIRLPAPACPPLIRIYTDFEMLMRYVNAKNLESEIAELISKGQWDNVYKCAVKAREIFSTEIDKYCKLCEDLPSYLRRFTDLWVYTRCISHGVEALQRQRNYEEAVLWLRYLLFSRHVRLFLSDARGSWWDRLALNLDSHLKQKAEAMDAIQMGLDDCALGDKDRLLLQDRGLKLDQAWKGPLDTGDPERVDIKGSTLGKALGDSRANRFVIYKGETSYECSVEEFALDYYVKHFGYKEGVHAEGAIWHTVFGLLCYDVIFKHTVPDVWLSETQMNPADLNSRSLYENRKQAFEDRFAEIGGSSAEELIMRVEPIYDAHYGETSSEFSWECFPNFEKLRRFMLCCRSSALIGVFRRIVNDYRNCRSGFPDLTLWNDEDRKLAVVEVKGPGDKLSTKQRLWLHYFRLQNVTAHVCHVAARSPKLIDN